VRWGGEKILDFSSATPEMIIGPEILERDWSVRTDTEKRCSWHFHIRRDDSHACVTYAVGDSLFEAEIDALEAWVLHWQVALDREDAHLTEIFGCDPLQFCAAPGCDDRCGLLVSIVRMENCRLTEDSPRRPRVVLFDLAVD
jgi:hypothetical protein